MFFDVSEVKIFFGMVCLVSVVSVRGVWMDGTGYLLGVERGRR